MLKADEKKQSPARVKTHNMEPRCWTRWLSLLMLPLFLGLIYTSFRQLSAAVIDSQTQQFLTFWQQSLAKQKDDFQLAASALDIVRQGANRVIALAPSSPDYLTALGQVENWAMADALRRGESLDSAQVQKGLQAYREAIRLRPAWPYGWADFAMAKSRAGEIDQEFFSALQQATRLGPWEKNVMDTVSQLGLWYQGLLPVRVRLAVDAQITRYAQNYPTDVMTIARAQNKTKVVCSLLEKPESFPQDCPPAA